MGRIFKTKIVKTREKRLGLKNIFLAAQDKENKVYITLPRIGLYSDVQVIVGDEFSYCGGVISEFLEDTDGDIYTTCPDGRIKYSPFLLLKGGGVNLLMPNDFKIFERVINKFYERRERKNKKCANQQVSL